MKYFVLACLCVVALGVLSLFVGVSDVTPMTLLDPATSAHAFEMLMVSRVPRTLALVLAGAALAVAGLIMQMLVRNRFVEPSTAGTVESASLGLLVVMLLAPGLPVILKMLVAAAFALAGTAVFLGILRRVPLRSEFIVPLIGLMLGGVIEAGTNFVAFRHDLLQSLNAYMIGDFSAILRGRYELLWISFGLTCVAYVAADRFTVAGLGQDFTTNLGLDYRKVMAFGMVIVSLVTATVVVTCGVIPFLGLVVPNIIRLVIGDNLRRTLPWVALLGAALVISCDILARLVIAPYEIPIGTIMGVIGSGLFLYFLLRRRGYGE
ncbi:ABC transporter permease [Nisaea nitritireducens]|uniref:ABC transporter permease n=1 Tax=Nisaea nitritireducens TaxID=568392 RepID=UPI001868B3C0|nr:iron chelate uptake ABC transporter family permease subunit [Nisaea nitritireducens]